MIEGQAATDPQAPAGASPGAFRVVLLSSLGGALEFYDFIVYGAFAAYISRAFFPAGDALVSLMGALAVFAAGYLARPVGGLVFGRRGDRDGRRESFMLSLSVMSLATIGMGLVPSYAQAGPLATAAFVALRLVQGFCVGGELPGAITYAVEAVPPRRATLACGVVFGCVSAGVLLATGASAVLHALLLPDAVAAWGWRAAFVLGGLLGVGGWALRRALQESPAFLRMRQAGLEARAPLAALFQAHGPRILAGIGATALVGVFNGLLFAHMPAYLVRGLGYPPQEVAPAMNLCVVLMAASLVAGTWLADTLSRAAVYRAGCVLVGLGAVPSYAALAGHSLPLPLTLALVGLGSCLTHGTFAAILADLFPTRVRFSGVAVALNVGALLSGVAPLLATGLVQATGWAAAPGLLLVGAAALALASSVPLHRLGGFIGRDAGADRASVQAAASVSNTSPAGLSPST